MLHLYDRATMASASTLNLDPQLLSLLEDCIARLGDELIDYTEYLIVEAGDAESDIIRHIGFSPLTEPIDSVRFGSPGFHPFWDHLQRHSGWYEMTVSFGSAFAYVLLIEDSQGVLPELRELCRSWAAKDLRFQAL